MQAKGKKDQANCCGKCPHGICDPHRRARMRRLRLEALGVKLPQQPQQTARR